MQKLSSLTFSVLRYAAKLPEEREESGESVSDFYTSLQCTFIGWLPSDIVSAEKKTKILVAHQFTHFLAARRIGGEVIRSVVLGFIRSDVHLADISGTKLFVRITQHVLKC